MKLPPKKIHPKGEKSKQLIAQETNRVPVDTYGGRVYIDWDHETPVTSLGQLSFFIEFLKRTELFDRWIEACPLQLTSPNAPKIRDILGTILLSVLSGHTRYSHITTVRTDKVNAPLLGMNKIVSEDSVRRALLKISEPESIEWLTTELKNCYSEILHIPWILDVEVMPGDENASSYILPYLFSWLDSIPIEHRPEFIRGDCSFGTDRVMRECEKRKLYYLFKLKQTPNIKRFIGKKMVFGEWENAGQGWQGSSGQLQLMGWEKARCVIILRRKIKKEVVIVNKKALSEQTLFRFADMGENIDAYEYAALVTNLDAEIITLGSHYRDRADSENALDELKNQWGGVDLRHTI